MMSGSAKQRENPALTWVNDDGVIRVWLGEQELTHDQTMKLCAEATEAVQAIYYQHRS